MTIKTILHKYSFNTKNEEEYSKYLALCETLRATPGRGPWMNATSLPGAKDNSPEAGEIELETTYLFENQWNTPTHRVFDWYEGINCQAKHLKFGHYLDITPEMVSIRQNTYKCGYTGQQFTEEEARELNFFNTTEAGLTSYGLKEKGQLGAR